MIDQVLQSKNLIIFIITMLLLSLFSNEIGFRLGRRNNDSADEATRNHVNSFAVAMIGMLSLIIGFTYSMAGERFNNRKELIVNEANAIGTAYLRSKLIPSPEKEIIGETLRQYADARIEVNTLSENNQDLTQATARTKALQEKIWAAVISLSDKGEKIVLVSSLTQSLNPLFDLQEKAIAARIYRVPSVILLLLFLETIISLGIVGYGCGLSGKRLLIPILIMIVFILISIYVIVDLDRPTRGFIKASQQSLLNVKKDIDMDLTALSKSKLR
jgi:hypothetical protein